MNESAQKKDEITELDMAWNPSIQFNFLYYLTFKVQI